MILTKTLAYSAFLEQFESFFTLQVAAFLVATMAVFELAGVQSALGYDETVRNADQFGIGKLYARPHVAVVEQHLQPGFVLPDQPVGTADREGGVLAAGIARVVYAVADPNPVAAGGASRLRGEGRVVESGVLAQPGDGDAHQISIPNGRVNRASPSMRSCMSVIPCRNMSVRSRPIPNAKPL